MLMLSTLHSTCMDVCIPIESCLTASSQRLQKTHCVHYLQAATSPLTTPSTPHVPKSSSPGACKGRGSNMFSGGGSGDYCGILAAKSQQAHPQVHDDLIAASEVHPLSSAVQPDDHMQPQFKKSSVEQQAQHNCSSGQQRRLPGEQQVQATEQLLQSLQHQPIQLGGQLAPFNGQQVPDERQQQVQPRGQSEEGRPSRQTEKAKGQKKARKKKQQGPSQQQSDVLREGKMKGLECERVMRWGHDKFEETQVFTIC